MKTENFSRAAAMLLMMLLTATTAWAATKNLGGYNLTVETDNEGSYYKIDCADALIALASYVNADGQNTCSGKRFKQTADIDMSGKSFSPIGKDDTTNGVFTMPDKDVSVTDLAQPKEDAIALTRQAGGDITQNSAVLINSSNLNTYEGKTVTGTVPSNSYATPSGLNVFSGAIVIDGIDLNLTIEDFSVDYSGEYSPYSGISLVNGAKLHLTVKGTNTLKAGYGGAGISVPKGCELQITASSDGTLNAIGGNMYGGGAGIGDIGDATNANDTNHHDPRSMGKVIIDGGT
jgi:hypothetical protein